MRRAAAVLGLVVLGTAVWGLVVYGPDLRYYLRIRWRAIADSRREPAALEAWRHEFGDPAGTRAAHGDNATAARLRALGAGAGVDLDTTTGSQLLPRAIADYVTAEDLKTGGPVGPPPDAVRAYLDGHRPGLDAAVDLLTQAEAPSWKTSDAWARPPDVSLLAIKQLGEVLAAAALADSSRGRDAEAERALLASWQLGASIREHPEVIGQFIVEGNVTVAAILARRLRVDAAAWRGRLAVGDDLADMMQALVIHSSRMWNTNASQMARAARADYLDLQRAQLVRLRTLPATTPPVEASYDENQARRDGWSMGAIVAVIGYPGDLRAWYGAEHARLELELSDRVLEARQLKAQLGRWPTAIPNLDTSRLAGVHWTYSVASDGQMSVAVVPTLQPLGPPLRFESRE